MSELKRCRCCHEQDAKCMTEADGYAYVLCFSCLARGPYLPSNDLAIEAWNTRPEEDRLKAEIAECREEAAALRAHLTSERGKSATLKAEIAELVGALLLCKCALEGGSFDLARDEQSRRDAIELAGIILSKHEGAK